MIRNDNLIHKLLREELLMERGSYSSLRGTNITEDQWEEVKTRVKLRFHEEKAKLRTKVLTKIK